MSHLIHRELISLTFGCDQIKRNVQRRVRQDNELQIQNELEHRKIRFISL